MLNRFTYRQKCFSLLGGFILFLLLGYQFSFADTFVLADEIESRENKLAWLKEKEKELPALKSRMDAFEKAWSRSDSGSVRDRLTAFISDFAENNNCLVTEIPHHTSFNSDQMNVQTNTFTLRGNYHKLLTLLHLLETDYQFMARIMSARFYTIRDPETKKKNLYLTIITQSFEKK